MSRKHFDHELGFVTAYFSAPRSLPPRRAPARIPSKVLAAASGPGSVHAHVPAQHAHAQARRSPPVRIAEKTRRGGENVPAKKHLGGGGEVDPTHSASAVMGRLDALEDASNVQKSAIDSALSTMFGFSSRDVPVFYSDISALDVTLVSKSIEQPDAATDIIAGDMWHVLIHPMREIRDDATRVVMCRVKTVDRRSGSLRLGWTPLYYVSSEREIEFWNEFGAIPRN